MDLKQIYQFITAFWKHIKAFQKLDDEARIDDANKIASEYPGAMGRFAAKCLLAYEGYLFEKQ